MARQGKVVAAAVKEKAITRQRRSSKEIRERLLRASREEFEICGYSEARTAAIAKRAKVTEAQLFRYFPSKSDLFRNAVFEPLNEHFSIFIEQHLSKQEEGASFREVERLYTAEFQQFLDKNARLLLSALVAETYSPDHNTGLGGIDSLQTYFERAAAMMSKRLGDDAELDPAIMVRVCFAATLGCVLFKDWLFSGTGKDREQVDRAITEFILDGVGDRV